MSKAIKASRFGVRVLSLLFAWCASAQADNNVQQDLYLDAMQSIIEGRQQDASETLMRMIEQEPQHAGAWLDLAIIQCDLGQAKEVERILQIIETRFSPPPSIMEVINRLRMEGCKGWEPRHHISVMVGRGIDNNVNQGASSPNFSIGTGDSRIELQLQPEYLPRGDQYTTLSGEYMREMNPNGGIAFIQARTQQNDSLSNFNTTSLALGLEQPWRAGSWSIRGSGVAALLNLGGHLYQRQAQAQVRLTPPLPLPQKYQFSMVAGASRVEYVTLTDYNSTTWEMRGLLTYRSSASQAQASLGYLTDRATSNRPGGDRNGWLATLSGSTRLGANVTAELGWTRQTWTASSAYSPGLIDQARYQQTQVIRGALIIPVSPKQALNIEMRQVRNNENISIFQYNSRQFQVSWQWQGF